MNLHVFHNHISSYHIIASLGYNFNKSFNQILYYYIRRSIWRCGFTQFFLPVCVCVFIFSFLFPLCISIGLVLSARSDYQILLTKRLHWKKCQKVVWSIYVGFYHTYKINPKTVFIWISMFRFKVRNMMLFAISLSYFSFLLLLLLFFLRLSLFSFYFFLLILRRDLWQLYQKKYIAI